MRTADCSSCGRNRVTFPQRGEETEMLILVQIVSPFPFKKRNTYTWQAVGQPKAAARSTSRQRQICLMRPDGTQRAETGELQQAKVWIPESLRSTRSPQLLRSPSGITACAHPQHMAGSGNINWDLFPVLGSGLHPLGAQMS